MSDQQNPAEEVGVFMTPLRRAEIKLLKRSYESGMEMLEIRVREGRRFTTIELDAETARALGEKLQDWAASE